MPMPKNKVTISKKGYNRKNGPVKPHDQDYHVGTKNKARRTYYQTTNKKTRQLDESKSHSRTEKLLQYHLKTLLTQIL